jgi:hypothetical protein
MDIRLVEQFAIYGSNCCVFVIRRVCELMISACVVPTVKQVEEGVVVLRW